MNNKIFNDINSLLCYFKYSQLQWNRFRNIKCEDVDYGYDIRVVTKILTLKDTPEDQLKRLLLIGTLYEKGLNSVQIS